MCWHSSSENLQISSGSGKALACGNCGSSGSISLPRTLSSSSCASGPRKLTISLSGTRSGVFSSSYMKNKAIYFFVEVSPF